MNTLQEKIAVLKAMEEGSTIQYSETDGEENDWEDLKTSELDFSYYTYRIKPNETTKFKVGDNLVFKMDENKVGPVIYKVIKVKENFYDFYNTSPYAKNEAEQDFIDERDVLWYFEFYDYSTKKYSMHPTRMTMNEMDKEFGAHHDTLSWQPMYHLGFRLKEDN